MKRISAILIALILVAAVAILPASAGVSGNPRVVDKADLLTDDQEAALASKLSDYSEKRGYDIALLTEPDLLQESFSFNGSVSDFADEYYATHNFDADGVLIFVVLSDNDGDRQIYISTSGECIKRFTDEEREEMFSDVRSDLVAGDYYSALDKVADELNDKLQIRLKWYMLPLAIIIGFALAMIIMMVIKGKLTTVAMQRGASSYVRPGSMHVTASRDTYLYSTVSRTARQSSSSGSSSHSSSGGSTHGGGGMKF